MTITEAAEKYYEKLGLPVNFTNYADHVTHYESLMRAAGYEWVKVDGEKETIGFIGPKHMAQAYSALKTEAVVTRPTDMEQEAREMFKKHVYDEYRESKLSFRPLAKDQTILLAALTEFGKMCKERGREEAAIYFGKYSGSQIAQLQQQLAEKDAQIEDTKSMVTCSNHGYESKIKELQSELTAAKAEIERLKSGISKEQLHGDI